MIDGMVNLFEDFVKVVDGEDIFDLTEEEFKQKYGVTDVEYQALVKASQEV